MTKRSHRVARVRLSIFFFVVLFCLPAAGWSQDQQPATAPTVSAETSTAVQQMPPSQPPAEAAAATPAAATQAGSYTIRQGDTLWDISSAQYRDPFLWPLIWKANPSINDPDLIYPGANLVIPSLAPVEQAMAKPEAARAEEKKEAPPAAEEKAPSFFKKATVESTAPETEAAPVSKLVLPEETTPPLVDKYDMVSAGFISDETSKDTLVGSVADPTKTLLGSGDEVYIDVRSRQDVKVGDRFLIYRPDHDVRHPVTNRSYGPLNTILGILKVTVVRENDYLTAVITTSFDSAESGDLLTPYQEPELLYPSKEKKTKDITGYVLETRDYRKLNGQIDVVYLDKGKVDGVDPGDVFTVQTDNGSPTGLLRTIGEVQVYVVKERTATAVVRKSVDAISRGDEVQFKN
jgi:hypothetical protein